MSTDAAREARKQQTLARLQKDAHTQVDKERKQKGEKETAYETKLEAEKMDPRCLECGICCEPRTPSRFVTCDDRRNPHKYCEVCVRQHLRQTIFEKNLPWMRCLGDGCVAFYKRADYEPILEQDALAMRNRLETRVSLKHVDGLTPCPACDFAAFVDAGVEIFECRNPKCLTIFCLKCEGKPHPGLSCVQAGKRSTMATAVDAKADPSTLLGALRRKVEDAVSEAVIRRCADCNTPFIKDAGCNQMKCICGNIMCYACQAQRVQRNHWSGSPCVLYESTETREEQERRTAEATAIAQVLRENPDSGLRAEDMKVGKVSRAVEQDDAEKKAKEAKALSGLMWMPGMQIEGGDEDVMAEVQMQMAGVNFLAAPAGGGGRLAAARAEQTRQGDAATRADMRLAIARGQYHVYQGRIGWGGRDIWPQLPAAHLTDDHTVARVAQPNIFRDQHQNGPMYPFGRNLFFQQQRGFDNQFGAEPAVGVFGQPDERLERIREGQLAQFVNQNRLGPAFMPPQIPRRRRGQPWW